MYDGSMHTGWRLIVTIARRTRSLREAPMKSPFPTALTLLIFFTPALGQDLSGFGVRVEGGATRSVTHASKGDWTPAVCVEIQRMEKLVTEGARPTDRPLLRVGLLFLQQKHCGVDVSAKLAADQKVLDDAKGQADRDFEQNMEAAARAAATPPPSPTIVIQSAPAPSSSLPDPSPSINCTTTRLGGGISTTNCR